MQDEPLVETATATTQALWEAPVRPLFRVLAGLLTVLMILGGAGLVVAAWREGWVWLLAVPVLIAFGIVMGQVAIRGRASMPWIRGILLSLGLVDL